MKNKVDIALIQPPGWAIQNPPLGLALLKSYLANNEITAKTYDLNILLYNVRHNDYASAWDISKGYDIWDKESVIRKMFSDYSNEVLNFIYSVLSANPAVIGFSAHCSSMLSARMLAARFKHYAPEIPIVFGGPQVALYTSNWSKMLHAQEADAIVFGEGEASLTEFIKTHTSRSDKQIDGVAFRGPDGQIVLGGKRELIRPLDNLPFADFSDFDLKFYAGTNVLPTYFSRGCINTCIYCTENKYFPKFRNRSGKRLYDEIVYQLSRYPKTEFFRLHDSVSNGNVQELEYFCDLLIGSKLNIHFNLENAVIRKEMNSRLYTKLRKAGCRLIGYGLETPSKRLLRSIGKNACLNADFDKVIDEGVRSKMTIGINMMFGLPGETSDDFQLQLDFIKRHKGQRKRILINPALNYTYFPEGCAVNSAPEKYGIDLSKGELFWTSQDGENTFIERMNRFEKFCALAHTLGYKNLFNITESINKHEMLGKYYSSLKEYSTAVDHFLISFNTETKTQELADSILRLYDTLSIPKDTTYELVLRFQTEQQKKHDSAMNLPGNREELEAFILDFSVTDSMNDLNNLLEGLYDPPRKFEASFDGIKSYIIRQISKLAYVSDKKYFMLVQSIKHMDNKIKALAAQHKRDRLKRSG